MDESSRWLMEQGRFDKMMTVMKKIAEINGQTITEEEYDGFKTSIKSHMDSISDDKKNVWYFDLFKSPRLRKNTILVILNWIFTIVLFDAHVRNVSNLKFFHHCLHVSFIIDGNSRRFNFHLGGGKYRKKIFIDNFFNYVVNLYVYVLYYSR